MDLDTSRRQILFWFSMFERFTGKTHFSLRYIIYLHTTRKTKHEKKKQKKNILKIDQKTKPIINKFTIKKLIQEKALKNWFQPYQTNQKPNEWKFIIIIIKLIYAKKVLRMARKWCAPTHSGIKKSENVDSVI